MRRGLSPGWLAALATLSGCAPAALEPLDPDLGGASSVPDSSQLAFTYPVRMSAQARVDFVVGNNFFADNWVTAPSSTTARDGLGPTFNARSCAGCHLHDGRGRPPEHDGEAFQSLLVRISVPGVGEGGETLPVPGYGLQLQPFGILGVPGEGTPVLDWATEARRFADGLEATLVRPTLRIEAANFGAFPADLQTSVRVAPAMIGLGLLEAIPLSQLEVWEDSLDEDGDGISGRIHWLGLGEARLAGRFGWKAGAATVRAQCAAAFLGDLGVTTSLHPEQDCPPVQEACANAPTGGMPEASAEVLDAVVFYSRTLAVPRMRNANDSQVIAGYAQFGALGCAACHRSEVTTGPSDLPALAGQSIRPFTDLLLHDMGEDLADGRTDGDASGREWRTPPLWGIGLVGRVNGHTRFLHDGRARNIEEAILWHDGEGAASRDAYLRLALREREALLAFLHAI